MKNVSISIVGCGNVGTHLALELSKCGFDITHVMSRSANNCNIITKETGGAFVDTINELPLDNLTIVCVPDDETKSVVESFPANYKVAYTSGSVELDSLDTQCTTGVFYPLQTFRKNDSIKISEVPFLIESNDSKFAEDLFNIASQLSNNVIYSTSDERKTIHVAAVMVNNFTNHIISHAQEYCHNHNIDFNILKPLLAETLEKLKDKSAFEAQTGPARRNDQSIINEHLKLLEGTQSREIYKLLSESINKLYNTND